MLTWIKYARASFLPNLIFLKPYLPIILIVVNIQKMKMTEWSKQTAEAGLPRQWRRLPTKVIQILFDLISPNILLLQSHDMFTVVDTAKVELF